MLQRYEKYSKQPNISAIFLKKNQHFFASSITHPYPAIRACYFTIRACYWKIRMGYWAAKGLIFEKWVEEVDVFPYGD